MNNTVGFIVGCTVCAICIQTWALADAMLTGHAGTFQTELLIVLTPVNVVLGVTTMTGILLGAICSSIRDVASERDPETGLYPAVRS